MKRSGVAGLSWGGRGCNRRVEGARRGAEGAARVAMWGADGGADGFGRGRPVEAFGGCGAVLTRMGGRTRAVGGKAWRRWGNGAALAKRVDGCGAVVVAFCQP